jgi:hypothetical protein
MSQSYECQSYSRGNSEAKFIRPPALTRSNYACSQMMKTDCKATGPSVFRFPLSLIHPDDIPPQQMILPNPEWTGGFYTQTTHNAGATAYQVYSDEELNVSDNDVVLDENASATASDTDDDDMVVTTRPETLVMPAARHAACTIFTLPNGEVRNGYTVYDNIYWLGECKYADGSTYYGDWMNGKRHGLGKIVERNGYMYYGWWEDDMRHGQGEANYPDGSMFDGDWKYDKKYGFGRITRPDGTKYDGEWINDKRV